jgi:hypothetical protein
MTPSVVGLTSNVFITGLRGDGIARADRPAVVLTWIVLIAGLSVLTAAPTTRTTPLTMAELGRDRLGHPEWPALSADILQGSRRGPGGDRSRKAIVPTRRGQDSAQFRPDRVGDGQVARDESHISDADIARLDDGAGVLAAEDFDRTPAAPGAGPRRSQDGPR